MRKRWQDIVGWASPTSGPSLAGLPWIQTQAGLAGAEATWAVTAAANYQTYVSQLGIAEVNYADTNASDFLNEIKTIDAARQDGGRRRGQRRRATFDHAHQRRSGL